MIFMRRYMTNQTGLAIKIASAAGGLFVHWGVNLPMSIGAVAMKLSTIIVAVNAQLLRRLSLLGTGSSSQTARSREG